VFEGLLEWKGVHVDLYPSHDTIGIACRDRVRGQAVDH